MSPTAAIRVFVTALLAFALGGCVLAPTVGADERVGLPARPTS
ncbi:hypothetical protein [Variovorax sp. RCC_210]